MRSSQLIFPLLMCLLFSPMLAQQGPFFGLKACYPFDGNAQEALNERNGKCMNTEPAYNRNRNGESAIHLKGDTNSYVSIPSELFSQSEQLSVLFWFKIQRTEGDQVLLQLLSGPSAGKERFRVELASCGELMYRMECTRTVKDSIREVSHVLSVIQQTLSTNKWYSFGIYSDSRKMKCYINGEEAGNLGFEGRMSNSVFQLAYLGGGPYAGNRSFEGELDQLRIYHHELNGEDFKKEFSFCPDCEDEKYITRVNNEINGRNVVRYYLGVSAFLTLLLVLALSL